MTSVLILLVLCIVGYTDQVLSAATIEPDSLNVSLNSIATFTCSSFGANFLYFTIDEVPVSEDVNDNRGLNEESQSVINGTRYRNLTVEAKVINNSTNISCVRTPGEITAEPALLKIQGLLASVGDLNYTYINGSSVNLSWTAPYTLDNVPITGYYVDDGFNNFNTNNTNGTLSTTDPDPCVLTNISVAAINGAGIGQTNNISFYYQRVPLVMPTVSVIPAVNGARQVSLEISIDVNSKSSCIGEYPNNITVIILDSNDVVQVFNILPQVNNQMIISGETDTSIVIPNNAMYSFNVTVLMSNNGGEFHDKPSFQYSTVGPVTAISSFRTDDCSTIRVSWESPHMLFILKVLNDTGYILDNVTVNGASYQFEDKDLFIHRYTYVITGVNELGEGISINKTFSYQQIPRAANAIVSFGEYIQNNVTVNFTIPIILECTGEAPENVTVTIQCNETGIVFNTTYTVESDSRPMDITEQLPIPQHQECNISALFINANGSDLSIMEFDTIPPMTPSPNITGTTLSPSPIITTETIIIIITIVGILLISLVLVIVLSLLLCYRKNKKKYADNSDSPNLERVAFDGSNVCTSFESTTGLLTSKSSTDEQPTSPTSPTYATSPTGATSTTSPTGATGATKEPIYSDLGQIPKVGVAKPIQSERTVQYADINTIVPKQRATQSYDDVVVVGAGTTVIGGGPAVPPPAPAKGGESKPPPVPKKTNGATTTQIETKNNDAARNLPHHIEDVIEERWQEGGGPRGRDAETVLGETMKSSAAKTDESGDEGNTYLEPVGVTNDQHDQFELVKSHVVTNQEQPLYQRRTDTTESVGDESTALIEPIKST